MHPAPLFIIWLFYLPAAFFSFAVGRRYFRLRGWRPILAAIAVILIQAGYAFLPGPHLSPKFTGPVSLALIIAGVLMLAASPSPSASELPGKSTARGLPRSVVIALVVFGVLLLAWPVLAFGDIFLFDMEAKNHFYEGLRARSFYVYVLYPLFYGVSLVLAPLAWRRQMPRTTRYAAFLPLVPLVAQGILFLPMILPKALRLWLHLGVDG